MSLGVFRFNNKDEDNNPKVNYLQYLHSKIILFTVLCQLSSQYAFYFLNFVKIFMFLLIDSHRRKQGRFSTSEAFFKKHKNMTQTAYIYFYTYGEGTANHQTC